MKEMLVSKCCVFDLGLSIEHMTRISFETSSRHVFFFHLSLRSSGMKQYSVMKHSLSCLPDTLLVHSLIQTFIEQDIWSVCSIDWIQEQLRINDKSIALTEICQKVAFTPGRKSSKTDRKWITIPESYRVVTVSSSCSHKCNRTSWVQGPSE